MNFVQIDIFNKVNYIIQNNSKINYQIVKVKKLKIYNNNQINNYITKIKKFTI